MEQDIPMLKGQVLNDKITVVCDTELREQAFEIKNRGGDHQEIMRRAIRDAFRHALRKLAANR